MNQSINQSIGSSRFQLPHSLSVCIAVFCRLNNQFIMPSISTTIQCFSKVSPARMIHRHCRSIASLSTPTDADKEELFRLLHHRPNSVITDKENGRLSKYNQDWMVRVNSPSTTTT
jgi:hypothetical protein